MIDPNGSQGAYNLAMMDIFLRVKTVVVSLGIVFSALESPQATDTLHISQVPIVAEKAPVEVPLDDKQAIQDFILRESQESGINPEVMLCIARHESHFYSEAVGDTKLVCKQTGEPMESVGIWQINSCHHPEVPRSVALSITSSTAWAIQNVQNGKIKEWSTYATYCDHLPVFQ